ncbi:MAG: tyrosine-type recombinase/integrase, partial [Acidobacteriaceae bacterium]|nr:tyrosine-type recombinase/integrase [Acidobacteriaceae bacterium]
MTLSYEPHEVSALLDACDKITNFNETFQERAGLRARAPILLLLYSGLRISDAITLERRRVDAQGRILMYAMKTGVPLYIKLHRDCISALKALPVESPRYFFWSGNGRVESQTGSAR